MEDLTANIKRQLLELADEKYKIFSSKLLPNTHNIIGVRLPALRKLAKTIVKDDWRSFLKSASNNSFEEIMLQGMIIGYAKADIEESLRYVSAFIPKIDNWSVCDSFCTGLKFTKDNMSRVWTFIQSFIKSKKEYEIRFGVVMLIYFYIEEHYIDEILQLLDNIKHEGYYAKMAVAWAISMCYIKFPEKTLQYLKNNALDDFTYNKALQKIIESFQVDKETKLLIRNMKRN